MTETAAATSATDAPSRSRPSRRNRRSHNTAPGRRLGWLAMPLAAWLIMFFAMPVALVFWFSLGYKPDIFTTHSNDVISLDRYVEALQPATFAIFQNSLGIGLMGTALCLIVALPMAYWIAVKAKESQKGLFLALVMIPFWTNFLVRTLGWQILLAPEGWLSQTLLQLGITAEPFAILYTREAVLLGVVYNYLPLMILPLFVALDRVGPQLREASKDLGANKVATFFQVTLPIAGPGIITGAFLVFIPLMGDYITATILGGTEGGMIGQLVASQFQTAQNWALGSAMAVVLIIIVLLTAAVLAGIGKLLIWPIQRSRRVHVPQEES